MATIRETATIHPDTIDRVVQNSTGWYDRDKVPEAFRDLPADLLLRTYQLAGGDWRRVVRDDGEQALNVLNHPAW